MPFLDIFSKKQTKKVEFPAITIDHREKNSLVASHLTKLGHPIEFKQLPVADYIIKKTAIERKTLSDLKSSIINKRIISQLLEIKQYPNHLLLIEGANEDFYTPPLHENALRGFILSIALEEKIPVIFTQNEKDTALYLSILARKQTKSNFSIRPSKILKSPKEQLQFILEGFPNIGPAKSKSLISKFKSLKNILNAPLEELQEILGKRAINFKELIEKEL